VLGRPEFGIDDVVASTPRWAERRVDVEVFVLVDGGEDLVDVSEHGRHALRSRMHGCSIVRTPRGGDDAVHPRAGDGDAARHRRCARVQAFAPGVCLS